MSRNILLGYSGSLVGVPPSPRRPPARPAEHAYRRGFALPAVASSCTSAQERGGAILAVNVTKERLNFVWLLNMAIIFLIDFQVSVHEL